MPNQTLGVLLIVEESKALQPVGYTLGLLLTGLPQLQPIRQLFSGHRPIRQRVQGLFPEDALP